MHVLVRYALSVREPSMRAKTVDTPAVVRIGSPCCVKYLAGAGEMYPHVGDEHGHR